MLQITPNFRHFSGQTSEHVRAVGEIISHLGSAQGRNQRLIACGPGVCLLPQIADDLVDLARACAEAGFILGLASGFRGFDRQLVIWQEKACGKRAVLDDKEQPLDVAQLTAAEQLEAIMRWSAAPGLSRHHWGSDFDVYPANLLPEGASLDLTCDEAFGPFAAFYEFLDGYLKRAGPAFARPYFGDFGIGLHPASSSHAPASELLIAQEPWHLSHIACSAPFERLFDFDQLVSLWREAGLALVDELAEREASIARQYFARLSGAL